MKHVCLCLYVLLLVISGCSKETDLGEGSHSEHQQKEGIKQHAKMPAEMPNDFDFMVRVGFGEVTKNEMNTYQDTVIG